MMIDELFAKKRRHFIAVHPKLIRTFGEQCIKHKLYIFFKIIIELPTVTSVTGGILVQ